jgi:prevent-host-death family protein
MRVKTADLKNNLSRYLQRLLQTRESITILHRNRPVARIVPLRGRAGASDAEWAEERESIQAKAARKGVKIRMTEEAPPPMKDLDVKPTPAPDRRTDIETVTRLRREKAY